MEQAHAEYEEICKEVGAEIGKIYQREGKLVGFIFSGTGLDQRVFKESRYGWTPRKNTKYGKEIARRVNSVKTSDVKECLKVVGLSNTRSIIFSDSRAYMPNIIDFPASPPWALISIPWYDENPDTLAKYKIDREKNHFNANLESIMWEPNTDMVELKEWQYKKEICEWNEQVRANRKE